MQLQELAQSLTVLGLTEKQSKIYTANLLLGPVSAQKIAEQAGINRPTSYDILEELSQLGLVSRSSDGAKTVFVPGGTAALEDLLKKQADEIKQRQQELDKLLPRLRQIERVEPEASPIIRFVHGKEGVDAIWSYVIRKARPGTEVLAMTNHDEVLKVYPSHLKNGPITRNSKKISSKQFYYNSKQAIAPTYSKESARVPYPLAADVTLYEDKAVLLAYGKTKKGWSGIIIENKEIVTVLRQLFYMAWRNRDETGKKSVDNS